LPIGNDIVDLGDPETQPDAIHGRWDSRVFTEDEQRAVDGSSSPHRVRWRLWAAKESAYKAASKLHPGVAFHPSRFAVELLDSVTAAVHHEVGRFRVLIAETEERVHAVAMPEGGTLSGSMLGMLTRAGESAREGLDGIPSAARRASIEVRAMARDAIAVALRLDPADIHITTGGGIPTVTYRGAPLALDLSLSHHGRFLACAWVASPA
jgi:phosphopantetheinyl transferase (holo-ACP synthase)